MTNPIELENELRMHAEDIHSRIGYTDISCVMSKAADMIVSLTAERDGWKIEALEESRLNGMGAEREAKLRQELLTAHCQYEDWTKERTMLKTALAEAQTNDRCGMDYLSEIRSIVGGNDFPDMVKRVAALVAEVQRQKDCIRGLTDQCGTLVVEKNSLLMDHGGALCDKTKIEFIEGLLAADNALIAGLKEDVEALKAKLEVAIKALVDAIETIAWMYGCSSPADDEVIEAIANGRQALATLQGE